ncbi:MAG: anti-sigma factor [Hyphomicrobiaceae bacterium]
MITPSLPQSELDRLADEYVMGQLSADDAAQFEAVLDARPELKAAVARMLDMIAELDHAAPEREVPPDLWRRIDAATGAAKREDGAGVLPFRPKAGGTAPRTDANVSRRAFWQGAAAASLAGVVTVALAVSLRKPEAPRLIVVLLDAQAQPVSLVEAFPGHRIRVVPLGRIDVPAGKTLQVWTLPDPATGPVSMGLLEQPTAAVLDGPPLPEPKLNQLYEITIEPDGGSPTGKPTGPIVGKGFARLPQI